VKRSKRHHPIIGDAASIREKLFSVRNEFPADELLADFNTGVAIMGVGIGMAACQGSDEQRNSDEHEKFASHCDLLGSKESGNQLHKPIVPAFQSNLIGKFAQCTIIPAMRVLITGGPTHEPIDPVRYLGNRSSGQMGKACAEAAISGGHFVTLILGPICIAMPEDARRIDVQTSGQMGEAVMNECPNHDLLLMTAAVADYRPKIVRQEKMERTGNLTIELEATEDILAAVGKIKQPHQRTVGFSLGGIGNLIRPKEKLQRKNLDLIVANPLETMSSQSIEAVLIWRDGRSEEVPCRSKREFADILLQRAIELFP
jgi:phosphopantothenoylcysteine decarboxylase/phosphopantothenate--cysteine ligase